MIHKLLGITLIEGGVITLWHLCQRIDVDFYSKSLAAGIITAVIKVIPIGFFLAALVVFGYILLSYGGEIRD